MIAGGERLDEDAYLVAPTLFEGVADDAMLSCEEVFGPVTSLYRFSSLDEALERANAVEFGLSASIFTSNLADDAALRERGWRPASSTSTRRPRAPTSTSRSAASRARASARTSRAARRWSSTRRSSPSTRMSESWLVTGALGCIGAWVVPDARPRRRCRSSAYDLGEDRARLELVMRRRASSSGSRSCAAT